MSEAIQKARRALVANGFDTRTLAIADEFMPEAGGRDKAALQIAILDAAAAALAALDAETEVKVRELEWDHEAPTQWVLETWKAESIVGEYDIQREKDGTFSGFAPNAGTDIFHTLNAAKAAAQADYDRRIRSALVTPEARS